MLSAYIHKNGGGRGFSLGGMVIFANYWEGGDAFRIYTQKRRDKEKEYMYTKLERGAEGRIFQGKVYFDFCFK